VAKLFSNEWMLAFAKAWNADQDMVSNLAAAEFNSCVGFGCNGDANPMGVVEVKLGKVVYAGEYANQNIEWDMRAEIDIWQDWIENGFGLSQLGVAVSSGKLTFLTGDYRQMVRNPNLAKPFLRHFELMKDLKTEFSR